jgi:hypothetical protein
MCGNDSSPSLNPKRRFPPTRTTPTSSSTTGGRSACSPSRNRTATTPFSASTSCSPPWQRYLFHERRVPLNIKSAFGPVNGTPPQASYDSIVQRFWDHALDHGWAFRFRAPPAPPAVDHSSRFMVRETWSVCSPPLFKTLPGSVSGAPHS